LKVALITDGVWPYVLGGMQKHSYYLAKYLARNQVHVDLFHFNASDYDIGKLEFFSPEERRYIRSQVIPFPTPPRFPGHYLYASWVYSKRVFELLKPALQEYDFIYTKGFTGWKLISMKSAGKIKCCPVGVKFHGYEMFQRPPGVKIWLQNVLLLRMPVRYISRKADLVFSYGGKITEIICSLGVKEERIFELPSGVERERICDAPSVVNDRIKFLYLGRYERRKGIEELNAAISALTMAETERCEFNFIGPIPDDRRMKRDGVIYHGEIRDPLALASLVHAQDVLLSPSWSEGMPNAILEAMANGLAVAATDVGANRMLVKGNTGWMLSEASAAEIARTIRQVLTDDSAGIQRKKENALALIRSEFVWEKLAEKLIARLAEVGS
jgi:glycosyltransferase involved in cell wall biosynthesis